MQNLSIIVEQSLKGIEAMIPLALSYSEYFEAYESEED